MVDISVNVKKACSIDETAPKRKHVRACIVYTWDHRDSRPFWQSLRVTPIQNDEVQVFKCLILIHKVLQEGHKVVLKDADRNRDFIDSLGKIFHGDSGYGKLIREYDDFLLRKISFHRKYKDFNGTFEYEEYISLKAVTDPNEGYEAILDLMQLQDAIDDLQRVIFSSISSSRNSECKISALVPLVTESYGIYKFITSMLRAMHQSTGSDDALEPLRDRYNSQHARLYDFYADCSSIRYLTSLINVPKLSMTAPDLFIDEETGERRTPTPVKEPTPPPPPVKEEPLIGQPTGVDFWKNQQADQEAEQQRLQQEREAQLLAQQQHELQQQALFEQQRRELAQQQQDQQNMLFQQHAQGRVSELERDLLVVKNQYDQDQLLLQQYDQRVKQLEQEVYNANSAASQQIASKDQMINSIQEQISLWKNKYESIAKLYSQLRQEHLNLLSKFKKLQQRAASTQDAIDKRERLEREMKAKNIELADLIRERDRARFEIDKLRGAKDSEIDQLQLELRTLKDKLDSVEKNQSSNLTAIFSAHKRELDELKNKLAGSSPETEEKLREKEVEIEILQQTMDETIKQLAEAKQASDAALDEQIDSVLVNHLKKLVSIVDSVLLSGIARIQDAVFELDSPMQAGNQNSSPQYLLSIIEKAGSLAQDFGTAFNNFIIDGPNGDHAAIISTVSGFSTAISELVLNSKGVIRLSKSEKVSESILSSARLIADSAADFLDDLLDENLKDESEEEKCDTVIKGVLDVHERLKELSELTETLAPKIELKGELDNLVDNEMQAAADAISAATLHLTSLLNGKELASLDPINMEINKAILAAAIAITNAISLLIQAATDTQNEIVANGKGSSTRAQFYKKHNKWTEGMISAAKSVALSTNFLITTADGCLSKKNSHEDLIVASNDVAASTVQLVAAARVKATSMSKTQDRLEEASKKVSNACKSLVSQVQAMLAKSVKVENDIDFSKLSILDNRKEEFKQQSEIIKLENALTAARKRLGEIRKYSYQDDSDGEDDY